ncbi:MAG: transcription antitermination factor NusB [Bacteroidaceae bacterium]|nr:transcription antitermination factor NusB [Bacteroidaceae bacterium]
MINRELIRIKVVQLVYAYYQNEGKTMETAEKEFVHSLDKAYELYHTLLLLMLAINHMATRMVEMEQSKARRLHWDKEIPTKFIENQFIAQLKANKQLQAFAKRNGNLWDDEEELLRNLYKQITQQEIYLEYISTPARSYEEDRTLWRNIYRALLCNNDQLDEVLEDQSLYWNDDKVVIDTFVLKTIRRFEPENGADQELLPEYRSDEDLRFAMTLFRTAIDGKETFRQLIAEQTRNWDLERIATMDLLIMQIALAEITACPEIPLSVSINEYVELAKLYSTPRSGSYINGMLDTIAKRLISEGRLDK